MTYVSPLEMGTGILNRRHFVFYHGDAPCSKFDILTLNFPPLLVEKCKNVFQRSPGLEPGTSRVPAKHATSRPTRIWWFISVELCFYSYVAGNSNWECPTWNKEHPHGKKQNGVCSRYLSPSLRITFNHFREQEWKAVVYISFTRNCRNWISHLVLGFGPITKDYPAPLNKSFPKGKSRTEQGIMRSVGISPQSRTFFLQIKTFEFSVLESNPNKSPKYSNA